MKNDLPLFLGRFRDFMEQQQEEHFRLFRHWWEGIRPQMTALLEKAAEEEMRSAPRHNLFRLLNLVFDEQNTHSRLLADLLNPRGTHSQQHLFLEAFLRHCKDRHNMPVPSQDLRFSDWQGEREKAIPNGRVDIVLILARGIVSPCHRKQNSVRRARGPVGAIPGMA
jgi:hypothetical protein